ncbi:PepSY domain-containing protein [Actinoplanes couchii]|uniref:PepSY domain-containing protein n=1 Tax=Actinoplanes couchii TaxID=403638 RepID=A0ABQ3X229_9ACTN|nr:PepSY domain-containing protein [Actinoplanes couchii]MDR6316907.1 putative membrane protein YkoI [Actinoplanes couchii]GID52514.1 hypothetical protein Aco03nite_009180 [Actinoplanes couchii]
MRRSLLIGATIAGAGVFLAVGTALASADDSAERRGGGTTAGIEIEDERRSGSATAGSTTAGFEIEIDPELDARFGPRPVNAVQAAAIVTQRFPGARVIKAELDKRDDRPTWEVEFVLGGREDEVEVDAVNGAIIDD